MLTVGYIKLSTVIFLLYGLLPSIAYGAQKAEEAQKTRTLSVEFMGGSVDQYVTALKKDKPDLNVVVESGTCDVSLPKVNLASVSAINALKLIEFSAAGRACGLIVQAFSSGRGMNENELFLVTVKKSQVPNRVEPSSVKSTTKEFRVFSVKRLMARDSNSELRKIQSAIDAALDIQGFKAGVVIKADRDAGLLMTYGDANQMRTVAQVVAVIGKNRRVEAELLSQEIERLKAEISKLKGTKTKH
jgi:hypothetical protein